MFNSKRLILARKRRRLTGKGLAEQSDLSAITISRIENGETPDDDTVSKIAKALGYPVNFFFNDDPEDIDTGAVSFRSLTKMSAKERDSAIAAGILGLEVSDWIEEVFHLPPANLLDLSFESAPEVAARSMRQHFGLGEKPIGNTIALLEHNGVRVFSLSENTPSVDAFSLWRDEKPFVFLNNFKTAEHSIFDACHELGHLVLHRHAGTKPSRSAEREANMFASAFLMPANDVKSRMPSRIGIDDILRGKKRWRVSAIAMVYRLHTLNLLSEWQYKSTCIELTRRGYRRSEPDGIEREVSKVWPKVLSQLWAEKKTKSDIAKDLNIPLDELESLIWGIAGPTTRPDRDISRSRVHLVN